jgi:hypothetical protein
MSASGMSIDRRLFTIVWIVALLYVKLIVDP